LRRKPGPEHVALAPGILGEKGEATATMKSAVGRPCKAVLVCALLPWVSLAHGCASKANPVLPSTNGPNPSGLVSGGHDDGGTPRDALDSGDANDLAEGDLPSDAIQVLCDLVKQDCVDKSKACYPVSGAGKCQFEGGLSVQTACGFGGTEPDCARGLTCVTTSSVGGTCLPMCDVLNPIPICGLGNSCHPLPGFTTVGYCQAG